MVTKLEVIRRQLGLSQKELGYKINQSASTISQIERGFRKPWPKIRKQIAEVLGVAEEELFENDGTPKVTDEDFITVPVRR
ncbi:MAG TPA: XRE family transcriptional regulator [Caldanaerobacter subterraneus]|uniref:XRE family transcriptional regulator n=2 Tax=Thermoanaerobacteraceae TaxID=186814 RepID=A0A357VKR4_9THEO|nr:XRE family transcriptional regulator [Caldanaerobacter subterraneus]